MTAHPTETATILVADDSVFARRWAERLLVDAGHAVATAAGGERAYAAARASRPDVLVADEAMSGLTGRRLVSALREHHADMGMVLMSSSDEPGLEADALRLGVDRFVRTPCSENALAGAVAAARSAAAARRERRERETHNADEIRAAAAIQEALMPPPAAVPAGWSVRSASLPARDVGGDVFDLVARDERRLVVAVADVSGKGIAGALFAAMFQTAVRAGLARGDEVAAALGAAGGLMFDALARAGRFVTATVAEIDLADGRVTYADAGHGHHLLLGAGGAERALTAGGPPLGFLPHPSYDRGAERIAAGELLAIFSDGLVEGGGEGDPAGARAALAARLRAGERPEGIVAGAPDDDDRTLVVLGRKP